MNVSDARVDSLVKARWFFFLYAILAVRHLWLLELYIEVRRCAGGQCGKSSYRPDLPGLLLASQTKPRSHPVKEVYTIPCE